MSLGWLPSLEKELNSLEPHEGFRLWLTTETHPKFPPILLQSSLKVTYEAPPGVKRNLQRTYESWTTDYVEQGHSAVRAQALFALAWLHAVVQERRMLIPQGWSKFYEFSLSDLRAGASIIDRLCSTSGTICYTVQKAGQNYTVGQAKGCSILTDSVPHQVQFVTQFRKQAKTIQWGKQRGYYSPHRDCSVGLYAWADGECNIRRSC